MNAVDAYQQVQVSRGIRPTLGKHAALMIVAMAAATGAAAEVPKKGSNSVFHDVCTRAPQKTDGTPPKGKHTNGQEKDETDVLHLYERLTARHHLTARHRKQHGLPSSTSNTVSTPAVLE